MAKDATLHLLIPDHRSPELRAAIIAYKSANAVIQRIKAAIAEGIRVELRRGATAMTITWPTSAAADFALWTRELLR